MNHEDIAHWEDYSYKVQMLISSPKNCGTISQDEIKELGGNLFIYEYGSEELGDKITLYWVIDPNDDGIIMSRFTIFGSPATIAANDMMALLCRNKTIDKATEITYKGLEYFMRDNPNSPALPKAKSYAISMALDAVRCAAKEYFNETEPTVDEALVSNDSAMSLKAIKDSIVLHDIKSMQELTDYTKAGYFDKDKLDYLEDILSGTRDEIEAVRVSKLEVLDTPFRDMDTQQQVATIDKAIDDSGVRQFLIMDGGNMEILDVKINGKQIDVYIRYTGACNGCASANTSTLFAIETTLKEKIDNEIRVLPI
ncbi:MAG TPA: iron-sulfur cluster assembly scaffold protein NifU [Sulfurovum sp.]|nr:iron-sulfur cluster assembly scaffold protein NifU [Sulfurovum sp.]